MKTMISVLFWALYLYILPKAYASTNPGGQDADHESFGIALQPLFSTDNVINITLVCLAGAGVLVIFALLIKYKQQTTHQANKVEVIADKVFCVSIDIQPTIVDRKDFPPSYEQLFPNGPSCLEKDWNAHTTYSTLPI